MQDLVPGVDEAGMRLLVAYLEVNRACEPLHPMRDGAGPDHHAAHI